MSVGQHKKNPQNWEVFCRSSDWCVYGWTYLWISGLFLGFINSASAAFLWYMANRSLRVMSEDLKCCAVNPEENRRVISHPGAVTDVTQQKYEIFRSVSPSTVASFSCQTVAKPHVTYSTFDVMHNGD